MRNHIDLKEGPKSLGVSPHKQVIKTTFLKMVLQCYGIQRRHRCFVEIGRGGEQKRRQVVAKVVMPSTYNIPGAVVS